MNSKQHLAVGIDYSKNKADLSLIRGDGQVLVKHKSFPNSLTGFQQAKQLLFKNLEEHQIETLDMAGEATSYYWLPSFADLAQDPDLAAYQINLFLLNARWVKWFKKGHSPNHKSDDIDPEEIAKYLLTHRPKSEWRYDPHWLSLRFLTRLRFHLVKSLTREKNLLNLYLFLVHCTYTRKRPFYNHLCVTSKTLLAQPELLQEIQQFSSMEAAGVLQKLSRNNLKDPLENAQKLQEVLSEGFPLNEDLDDALQWGMELLLETINHLLLQIQKVEERIRQLVQQDYPEVSWLDSIPGVGLVLASGVAAEIGNLDRFIQVEVWDKYRRKYRQRKPGEVTDAVGKYAGLWWPKNESGQFKADERRLSREGNAYLRYYILQAGDCMRRNIPSIAAYYRKKYDQANKHKHKRALVLTGRKALDLSVTLLRRKECYKAEEVDNSIS